MKTSGDHPGPADPPGWATIDNRAAVRDLTARMLARGHARIAYLGYTPQGRWDHDREAGYRDAMTAASLPPAVTRTALDTAQAQATAMLCGGHDVPSAPAQSPAQPAPLA